MENVFGSFNANDESEWFTIRRGIVAITGDFQANWVVEFMMPQSRRIVTIADGNAEQTVDIDFPGASKPIRIRVTDYTSGTVNYDIDGRTY